MNYFICDCFDDPQTRATAINEGEFNCYQWEIIKLNFVTLRDDLNCFVQRGIVGDDVWTGGSRARTSGMPENSSLCGSFVDSQLCSEIISSQRISRRLFCRFTLSCLGGDSSAASLMWFCSVLLLWHCVLSSGEEQNDVIEKDRDEVITREVL